MIHAGIKWTLVSGGWTIFPDRAALAALWDWVIVFGPGGEAVWAAALRPSKAVVEQPIRAEHVYPEERSED
jgi:hypothetical protein